MGSGVSFPRKDKADMKGSRKKSLLYRYIVLGALTVMVPLCLMVLFWAKQNGQDYKRQRMDAENLLLIQLMGTTENEMDDLKKVSEQIMLDNEITPLRLKDGGFYTVEALKKLNYYCKGTGIFEDLMICLNGDKEIYRTSGKETFSTLSEMAFLLTGDLTSEGLYELLDSNAHFDFLDLSEQLNSGGKRKNIITFPLFSKGGESYGTLAGVISMDYFQEIIQNSGLVSDTIICNSRGEILFSTDDRPEIVPDLLGVMESCQEQKYFYEAKIQGEEYGVLIHHSDMTQWYYIRMVKKEELDIEQRYEVLPIAGLLVLLSFLLSGIIGVLLGFYHYLPVRDILRLFNPNISYSAKRDELSLINCYIRNLQLESHSIKLWQADKELQQTRWILTEILYGGISAGEADRELLEKYGFREHVCEFSVVLLFLEDEMAAEDFECRLKQQDSGEILFITRELGGGYLCLYTSEEKGLARGRIEEFTLCLEEEGYQLRVSMGQCKEVFKDLMDSLHESLLAAEVDGDSTVACLDSSLKSMVQEFWKPGQEELLLELAMRSGEKEVILKRSWNLEKEFSIVLRYYRNIEVQYVFHRIINYLVLYVQDMDEKENAKELLTAMMSCSGIKDFFATFRKSVEQFYGDNAVSERRVKDSRMQEIKDFVDENFCLPEMSLSYTADHFSLRDSYLSKIFKENIGENFIDYLLRKRLKESARLLYETDMTVKQVVNSVGYEDVTSFTKRFSAKYGMTPGVYRKRSRTERR